MNNQNDIIIYTDGCCLGNPGLGGYAAVLRFGSHEKQITGGFRKSTNNRMELMAVIVAIEALKKDGRTATIYTDSEYVSNAVGNGWVFNWEKKNFSSKKNSDLWKRFLTAYRRHNITIRWVRGHNGNEGNELCDTLSKSFASSKPDTIDEGYEATEKTNNPHLKNKEPKNIPLKIEQKQLF
jgi:ribonuclease HI